MSNLTDNELDLEKLFLPAWAQEAPAAQRYAKYTGNEGAPREGRRDGGDRPRRREITTGPGGPPRGQGGGGFRPGGDRPGGQRPGGPRPGGPRPSGGPRRDDRGPRRDFEPPAPLPEVNIALLPEEKGAESLGRQVKSTGRAYPLFQIASLVLQKPERYVVNISVKKKQDGTAIQPLFLCALDDTLWLGEDEAVAHVLKNHFGTFYQIERTPTDPPKGTYTFVAQCGMSGVILGPPNHNDYQNKLRKLHAERFSRMPFDAFKARVKIVKDEAVVKKWIDDLSFKTEYVVLNVPEPLKLANMEDVEKHFRSVHKDNIIKAVDSHILNGLAARSLRSRELVRAVRMTIEQQQRFPMQVATVLSQKFASQGLHFFKVNKTVTHVSVARPAYLDLEATPVSENIKRIVDFINAHPRCTRRKLFEALAPAAPIVIVPQPETPTGETPTSIIPAKAEPTAEQTAVNADLHWLIHQGHVIEFADGKLETAKKPAPRPPKPAKAEKAPAPKAEQAAEAQPVAEVTGEPAPAGTPSEGTFEAPVSEAVPQEPALAENAPINEPPAGQSPNELASAPPVS